MEKPNGVNPSLNCFSAVMCAVAPSFGVVGSCPLLGVYLCAFARKPEGNKMRDEHPISLRLKIRPELVKGLDKPKKINGLSMNEVVNVTIANALAAKGMINDRNHTKD